MDANSVAQYLQGLGGNIKDFFTQPTMPGIVPMTQVTSDVLQRGLHGLAQDTGVQTPGWSNAISDFLQKPGVNAALGTITPRASSFGKGWWYNSKNNALHEIDAQDLGPNGDHDGWISIGDNATKLGVDPEKARAFQVATYGADKDSFSQKIADFAKKHPDVDPWDNEMIPHNYEKDFHETFGTSTQEARQWRPDNLVRVRKWGAPLTTLSVDRAENIPGSPKKFVDTLLQSEPDLLRGVSKVEVDHSDARGFKDLTPEEFLNAQWHKGPKE